MTTPILLVTGFLGGGKTTLLRRIAAESSGRRLILIVNEFSSTDVDGGLVRTEAGAGAVIDVAGGSIFCRCKVTEFIELLGTLPSRIAAEAIEGVVIEASGMADPRTMEKLLQETGFSRFYRLARVVAVLDPASFLKLHAMLPVLVAQIQAADVILLNKADLYSEDTMRAAETAVRHLRPVAEIARTIRCATPMEWFPPQAPPRPLVGSYAACRDPQFETLTLEAVAPPDFERLRAGVERLREDIYRIKGVVIGSNGAAEFWEDDGHGLIRSPAPPGAAPTPLVVICRAGAEKRVSAALAAAVS